MAFCTVLFCTYTLPECKDSKGMLAMMLAMENHPYEFSKGFYVTATSSSFIKVTKINTYNPIGYQTNVLLLWKLEYPDHASCQKLIILSSLMLCRG